MGFRLTVEGSDTIKMGETMISFVHTEVGTPNDSMAKSTNVAATMWVTGKLLSTDGTTNSDTLKLYKWALVPAQSSDAYRSVIVEVVTSDQVFRKIHFPNAFVVDYNERYSDTTGNGEFSLVLRQKVDKVTDVKPEGGLALEQD